MIYHDDTLLLQGGGGGWKTRPRKTITSCMDGGVPTPTQDILHKSIKTLPLKHVYLMITRIVDAGSD